MAHVRTSTEGDDRSEDRDQRKQDLGRPDRRLPEAEQRDGSPDRSSAGALDLVCDGRQAGGRLLERHAGPQPPVDFVGLQASGHRPGLRERQPEALDDARFAADEPGRRHPDDRVWRAVQRDGAPDEGGVGREPAPPQRIGDDHHRTPSRRLPIIGPEQPAARRLDAEDAEEVAGHQPAPEAFGVASVGDVDRRQPGPVEADERTLMPPVFVEFASRHRKVEVASRGLPRDHDQLVLPRHAGKRFDQGPPRPTVDSRRGADSERKRGDRNCGKPGRSAEHPEGDANVSGDPLDDRACPDVAHALLDLIGAAQFENGLPPGLAGRHAQLPLLVGEGVDGRIEFLVEIPLDGVPPRQVAQGGQ